ncbi:MAG: glycosyltransferase [Planctomycetaceae bacterium]
MPELVATGPTVLLVLPNLDVGGAQESARTVASLLPAAGCPTVVCTFRDGPLRADLEAAGVPVEVLPARRHAVAMLPWYLAESRRLRRDLRRVASAHGASVLQCQTLGPTAFLAAALREPSLRVWWRIPNVVFEVSADKAGRHHRFLGLKRAAHRALYRRHARRIDGIVAVADDVADAFARTTGVARDRITVVPNGVDTDRYPAPVDRAAVRRGLGLGPQDRVLIAVGTFKRQKGHVHLLEAFAKVAAGHDDVHLLLAGDGDLRPEIERRVAELGIGGRVHLLGSRRDVPALLAASDGAVLPSLWEGMSNALVEAMASGLPVVATDVSGTNQVMVDGTTGWLVPPGEAGALAAAIEELLEDPGRARARGAAARERVGEAFGARRPAERLAALYRGDRALAEEVPTR